MLKKEKRHALSKTCSENFRCKFVNKKEVKHIKIPSLYCTSSLVDGLAYLT